MRSIRKSSEPASLTTHRLGRGAYNGYPDKEKLRQQLVGNSADCAATASKGFARKRLKVEHWHPQADYPDEQLDYRNLLAACRNGEGWPRAGFCEAHKGDRILSRNPADANYYVEKSLRYEGSGWIRSEDVAFDEEINSVLNLNHPYLVNGRKAILHAFRKSLAKRNLDTAALNRLIDKWYVGTPGSDLEPFCMVVVYWLRKRLARA